jgi:hypothetical protein
VTLGTYEPSPGWRQNLLAGNLFLTFAGGKVLTMTLGGWRTAVEAESECLLHRSVSIQKKLMLVLGFVLLVIDALLPFVSMKIAVPCEFNDLWYAYLIFVMHIELSGATVVTGLFSTLESEVVDNVGCIRRAMVVLYLDISILIFL